MICIGVHWLGKYWRGGAIEGSLPRLLDLIRPRLEVRRNGRMIGLQVHVGETVYLDAVLYRPPWEPSDD